MAVKAPIGANTLADADAPDDDFSIGENIEYWEKVCDDYRKFIDVILEKFEEADEIPRGDIVKEMPKFLMDSKKVRVLPASKVTKLNFMSFLAYQTHGRDFIAFPYLVDYFGLEEDSNGFVVFNSKVPFDSVRKEPLVIHYILLTLYGDDFVSDYHEYLGFELQHKVEHALVEPRKNMRYDICFPNVRIAIEINEEHHQNDEKTKYSDSVKENLTRLNGYRLIVFDFSKILGDGERFVTEENLRDSKYIGQFKVELLSAMKEALMNFIAPRQAMITEMFKEEAAKEVKSLDKALKTLKKDKSNSELVKILKSRKRSLYIINNSDCSNSVDKIFHMKDICYKSENKYSIPITNVLGLLGSNDDITQNGELYKFIKEVIIEPRQDDNFNEFISWDEFRKIIIVYPKSSESAKEKLRFYHETIGDSYEKIIKMIQNHTKSIISSPKVFHFYLAYLNAKGLAITRSDEDKIREYIEKIEKVESKLKVSEKNYHKSSILISKLIKHNEQLKEKIKKLEEELRILHTS